jgi:hypothetical protein
MNIQILANILKFLEKANVTGGESYAWCEAHQYIQNEINKLAQQKMAESANTGA